MGKVTWFFRSKVIFLGLFFCFILIANELHAQKKRHDPTHTLRINRHAMYSLVGWGALNSLSGTLLLQQKQYSESPVTLTFWRSNIAWGIINSGIGVLGLVQTNKAQSLSSYADITGYSSKLKRTYLVNAGLDIVYLGTGAYLNGRNDRPELQGLGRSILLQAAALEILDAGMYLFLKNKEVGLKNKVELGMQFESLTLRYKW